MNDPHVQALHYRIKHADSVDFDKAPPLEHEEPGFSVRIEKGQANVVTKDHYATSESARAVVEPFLRAWELSAALFSVVDKFEFLFEYGDVIDRSPTPGIISAKAMAYGVGTMTADAHVGRARYPSPPIGLARDAHVDQMFDRYCMYCENRTTLGDAGNYCLTALELAAGGRRKRAAAHFAIALSVVNTLGMLTATKGGKEARKAEAAASDYTSAERAWIQEALKAIIRRAAEVASNSTVAHKQITMADLPQLP
jgi:hypothetical protein